MDLRFTPKQDVFRAQVREWLVENVPDPMLPSMDTADGFEAHRKWERKLFDGGWGVVSWPVEYGGRGLGLVEWLIFEEEYYAGERAGTRQPERSLPPRPDADGPRDVRTEGAVPPAHGTRGRGVVPGLVGAERR